MFELYLIWSSYASFFFTFLLDFVNRIFSNCVLISFVRHQQSIRVTTQQGALIMANFMTEQLEGDMKRQEKVKKGELTQREADEEADKWETVRFAMT